MKRRMNEIAIAAATLAFASALACDSSGGPWETHPNTFDVVSAVETTNPWQFEIGTIFVDGRNAEFAAYVISRSVDERGEPSEIIGITQQLLGVRDNFQLELGKPIRTPTKRIHVSVVVDEPYNGQWDPDDPPVTAGGEPMEAFIDVAFESSLANSDSPFSHLSCGMGQTHSERRLAHKTDLDFDCRCDMPTVGDFGHVYNWESEQELLDQWKSKCDPYAFEGNRFKLGEGPQVDALGGSQTAGDVWHEREEIVFGVKWSSSQDRKFTLMAVDYNTGDRRFVSGVFRDPAVGETTFGEGPLGEGFAAQVRRGPDGRAYVMTHDYKIMAVDVETGDRELIWEWSVDGYGQCDNGVRPEGHPDWRLGDGDNRPLQLTVEGRGFVVAPDGSFYMPTLANGVPNPGYGVVRVTPDGSTCEHVSMSPAEERNEFEDGIGTGWKLRTPVETMVWHEGKLIGISVFSHTLQIDPETGDRVRLAGQGLSGTPSLSKVNRMFWDEGRAVFVLTGFLPPSSRNLATWDPDTNEAYAYFCGGADPDNHLAAECAANPMNTGPQAYWPGYLRPDGMMIVGFANGGFVIYEMETGNNHWFSY